MVDIMDDYHKVVKSQASYHEWAFCVSLFIGTLSYYYLSSIETNINCYANGSSNLPLDLSNE